MENRIYKTDWISYTAIVLMCLTLLSGSMVSGLYAKFTTGDSGSDSARAAAFVFMVDGEEQIFDLSDITKPGDTKKFKFTISNQNGNVVSEVDESYTVTFTTAGNLPLTYTLDGKNTLTAGGTFSAAVSKTETHELVVTWPDGNPDDIQYASGNGVASLSMVITATQID